MEESKGPNLHVMVLPFPGQGHMNPMLQFSKRLASKGVHITVATNTSIAQKMKSNIGVKSITFESVYDDSDEAELGLSFKARKDRFEAKVTENLPQLIGKNPVKCLVYDANLSWAMKVAKRLGIAGAALFTQSCTYVMSYYPLYLETLNTSPPPEVVAELSKLSMMPPPEMIELGALKVNAFGSANYSGDIKLNPVIQEVLSQFNGLDDADWVLFNSFDKLEDEVVKWMAKLWHVKNIGPTLPSIYLDKRVEYDVDYGFNLYKPNNDACMNWLDTKEPGSVVYVSFGSVATLSVEQTAEIAEALKQTSSRNFLWVVRETEEKKLPTNFIAETSDKAGLVVSWCPQLDVLAHEAVGCFVTHCGWNSTIEALCFGVPMLPMPQFLDQLTDTFLVDRIWGVGIEPKADEKGLITRQEIGRCLDEIMYGDGGTKIKENAAMWKASAKEAVDEGGSSDEAIDDFIARLSSDPLN